MANRTFAIDHDIHVYSVGQAQKGFLKLAVSNNKKHYGDVISSQHVLRFADCTDKKEVKRVFKEINLEPNLEIASPNFAFWKPDKKKYRTQSEPKEK